MTSFNHKIASGISILTLILGLSSCPIAYGNLAIDLWLKPTGENYIGVRYKAFLAEDELSETGFVLLFGSNGLTSDGEYQPHFIDLMIKGSWAQVYDDPVCAADKPGFQNIYENFTLEFGLSDYEDAVPWSTQDNDIAAWTDDPDILPRRFSNIDGDEPWWADKILVDFQVDEGRFLEGREIEVCLERGELTRLPTDQNFFMDPDLEGEELCKPCAQADIMYRQWIASLRVPSLKIEGTVNFYVNASQADKIRGDGALIFIWESPRPAIDSDKYKVILYDMEVKTTFGEWKRATQSLLDTRSPDTELPLNDEGKIVGGFRKVNYKGKPAVEASFGYGYTDYIVDENPNEGKVTDADAAIVDLTYPEGNREYSIELALIDAFGQAIEEAPIYVDGIFRGFSDANGESTISSLLSGYHQVKATKSGRSVSTLVYLEQTEADKQVVLSLDINSPVLSIRSPENKTYSSRSIPVNFTANEPISWAAYRLDGAANKTVTSNNETLEGLSDGVHCLVIYANDTSGNTGASEIVCFIVDTNPEPNANTNPETSPWLIVGIIAIVFAGTAGFALHRKRRASREPSPSSTG